MALYDCIVVGAGVIGSSTAYHLAKQGKRTLLLEQFFLPTTRGSSGGQSRIIRKSYNQPHYKQMLVDAYDMWKTIEDESGEELYVESGLLNLGRPDAQDVVEKRASLDLVKEPHEVLSNDQLKQRYPTLTYPDDFIGTLEYSGGILKGGKCVAVIQNLVKKYGGEIRDGTKMTELLQEKDTIKVSTTAGDFHARKIIITAGPWAGKVSEALGLDLPITPMSIPVYYWKSKDPEQHTVKNGFPVIVHRSSEGIAYLVPSLEYPGLCKVAINQNIPKYCDPDSRNSVSDQHDQYREVVVNYIRKYLPGLEDTPSIIEYCMYTKSKDVDFILDSHPQNKNILIATGFTGHGFKIAPSVGKLMAEMATDSKPSYDTTPFRISRFHEDKAVKK
ncbi:peroxisomal sarcosine oxidase-like [Lineus longissimus]|uniref:peroxisomal sarcosine oxidase-like n=1 Tax=Lineus longissimus TaxID=88925 RepID=UPI002B4E9790